MNEFDTAQWLANVNGTVYFAATDGVHGEELWKSDGTPEGTVLVKDIRTTPVRLADPRDRLCADNSSCPAWPTNLSGTLFFTADDGVNGRELWKSDGTQAGTVLMKDVGPGPPGSGPRDLTSVGGRTLFFDAHDGVHGVELWKSDGTDAGTVLVKDVNTAIGPSFPGSFPYDLTDVEGTLLFAADDGVHGTELWKSDGTAGGTVLVKDLDPGPSGGGPAGITRVGRTVYFSAGPGSDREPWRSDGTENGTVLVKEINTTSGFFGGSLPWEFTAFGGLVIFRADDGVNGLELWRTDGTEAGTFLVQDIHPGSGSSAPGELTDVTGTLFFHADDGVKGRELWKTVS